MRTSSKLGAAFRAYAAKVGPPAARRPSADEIAAYVTGKLSGAVRERVEEAISLDPEAAEMARDLALFHGAPPGADDLAHVTPQELARDWETLRARLPSSRTLRDGSPRGGGIVRFAIAAGLLVLPAIWLWGWSQRALRIEAEGRLAAALQPQVNVEPYTLWEPTVRGTAADVPPPVILEARGEAIWLRLGVMGKPRHDDYRLEVRALDRAGAPLLWRRDGLTLYSNGSFSVAFPRAALPPGNYELRMIGVDRATESRLATYRIRIPQPPPAG